MYIMNKISNRLNSFADMYGPAMEGMVLTIGRVTQTPQLFFSQIEAHFESLYPQVPLNQVAQMPDALDQHNVQQLQLPAQQAPLNPENQAQLPNIREAHRAIGLLGMKLSATAASVALLATASLGVASLAWGVGLGLTAISIIRTGNESVQQTIDSMKDFGTAATSATLQAVVVGAAAIYTFLFCKGTFMLVGALVKGFASGAYLGVSLAGKAAVAGYTGLKAGVYFAAPHVVKASTVALAALKSFGLFVGTKLAHGVTTGVAAAKSGAPIAASYIADKAVVGLAAVKSGLMFCYNLRG